MDTILDPLLEGSSACSNSKVSDCSRRGLVIGHVVTAEPLTQPYEVAPPAAQPNSPECAAPQASLTEVWPRNTTWKFLQPHSNAFRLAAVPAFQLAWDSCCNRWSSSRKEETWRSTKLGTADRDRRWPNRQPIRTPHAEEWFTLFDHHPRSRTAIAST